MNITYASGSSDPLKLSFWYAVFFSSFSIVLAFPFLSSSEEDSARFLIRHSVRCALPWLLLALSASSLNRLRPGRLSQWLLNNRREFGVAFAVVMVWQIIFIAQLLLVTGKNIIGLFPTSGPIGYLLLTSDLIGYVFIFLMAATSFDIGRRYLSLLNWKRLHRTGIWFLWFSYFYTFGLLMMRQENLEDSLFYFLLWLLTLMPALIKLVDVKKIYCMKQFEKSSSADS